MIDLARPVKVLYFTTQFEQEAEMTQQGGSGMTWDQLMGKIREGLSESGARIRGVGNLLPEAMGDDGVLSGEAIAIVLVALALAVSDLHSTIEHLTIGLDAVVETLREADKSQEVKGE